MTLARPRRFGLLVLPLLAAALMLLVYRLTWQPPAQQDATVNCRARAAIVQPGQALKVLTWNLQSLAGAAPADGRAPERRPGSAALAANLDKTVQLLRDEQADIVLLQGLHDGAEVSGYQDQLALLQERLSDLYPCSTQAFYWKAGFLPYPGAFANTGMKLGVLSRYRIERAERLQLPQAPSGLLSRPVKRALLVSYLPMRSGGTLVAINTQLDAFAPADDIQHQQLNATAKLLAERQAARQHWLLGGDLNALPPGQYQRLSDEQRHGYTPDSPLQQLAALYPMIPGQQSSAVEQARWYTYSPKDSSARRTLDYLLHSPALTPLEAYVRDHDTPEVSSHLPLIARLLLPPLEQPD